MSNSHVPTVMWGTVVSEAMQELVSGKWASHPLRSVPCVDWEPIRDTQLVAVLKDAPTLASEFNVALASGDTHVIQNVWAKLRDWWSEISHSSWTTAHSLTLLACEFVSEYAGCRLQEYIILATSASQSPVAECLDRPLGVHCLKTLRQILGLYARLTYEDQETRLKEEEAIKAFVERVSHPRPYDDQLDEWVATIGRIAFANMSLSFLQSGEWPAGALPHHGPGVVAEEGLTGPLKGLVASFADPRLDEVDRGVLRYPMEDLQDAVQRINLGTCFSVRPDARICAVPKDYRGPRVIAAEPLFRQYLQEGVKDVITQIIMTGPLASCTSLGHAEVNAHRALRASIDRREATIDMKDASDLVQCRHIETIFRDRPDILHWLNALRTQYVQDPTTGNLVKMTTFSVMGSSLTFPLETATFAIYILALWASKWYRLRSFGCRQLKQLIGRVHLMVHGDDILLRTDLCAETLVWLSRVGFVPNVLKCCYKSPFRESCGIDAWDGEDITPMRPRNLPGSLHPTLAGLMELVQMFGRMGYIAFSMRLYSFIIQTFHVVPPVVRDGATYSGAIACSALYELCDIPFKGYYDRNLQCWMFRGFVQKPRYISADPYLRLYHDALASGDGTDAGAQAGEPLEKAHSRGYPKPRSDRVCRGPAFPGRYGFPYVPSRSVLTTWCK